MNKRNIPQAAIAVSEREETFRSHTAKLNQTIEWYNKIRRITAPVEFDLIKDVVSIKNAFNSQAHKMEALKYYFFNTDKKDRYSN